MTISGDLSDPVVKDDNGDVGDSYVYGRIDKTTAAGKYGLPLLS
jgi:hypothetical protein